ncbi:hypothetical protein BKA64DRAFT_24045 [Cadophora sp. MPI-SDFR-AT-0126]|nr:hypothetical protein BKA64DRAFT_24045 [Leotiomycetes sp. MPI-SDFR-AT-0126]
MMSSPDSSEDDHQFIPQPLNIEQCAALHNTIAAIHVNSPHCHTRCRLQSNFWNVHNSQESLAVRDRLTPELIEYLSAISVFTIDEEPLSGAGDDTSNRDHGDEPPQKKTRSDGPVTEPDFTPALKFPYPWMMFLYEEWPVEDVEDEQVLESTVVLLYSSVGSKGGLFFDMSTNLCCWASVEGPSWPQRPTEWIPLETALERYLYCWQEGRYSVSAGVDSQQCGFAAPFSAAQLEKTLAEWEALLQAIEMRIPVTNSNNDEQRSDEQRDLEEAPASETPRFLLDSDDLEDPALLRDLNLMPPIETLAFDTGLDQNMTPCFLLKFLSRARKPAHPNMRIAPSITIFDARQARQDLLADRDRRQAAIDRRGDMNEWFENPILLFPYCGENGGQISDWVEWQQSGFGDLLVSRRAGLYFVSGVRAGWFDGVKFITKRPLQIGSDDVRLEIDHALAEVPNVVPRHEVDEESALHLTLELRGSESRPISGLDESQGAEISDASSAELRSQVDGQSRWGNDVLFCHDNFYHCPYFGRHSPRLMDLLRAWRRLVESGIVTVGPNGVEGTIEEAWEEARRTRRGLDEFDIGRCWEC